MRLIDLIQEGWSKFSDSLQTTEYRKNFNNLTSKDIELLLYGTDIYAFRNDNIPNNFVENQGEKVNITIATAGGDIRLRIEGMNYFPTATENKNYTHLVYKISSDLISRDLFTRISLTDTPNLDTKRFLFAKNLTYISNTTLRNISIPTQGVLFTSTGGGTPYIQISPFLAHSFTGINTPTFSDTSTPYTTINTGTYTFNLDLFKPHYLVGAFVGGNATSQAALRIHHETSSNNGATWNILQSFSLWAASSYITTFFLPLTVNINSVITNRRIRYQALTNITLHYFYVIYLDQASGNVRIN